MANTKISGLAAGSAVAATDLFPAVETAGTGPVTKTGTQVRAWAQTFAAPVAMPVYTVSTLPTVGTAGRMAYVSDGDASLGWGVTVINSGAGATPYQVWDNGTHWTVVGK